MICCQMGTAHDWSGLCAAVDNLQNRWCHDMTAVMNKCKRYCTQCQFTRPRLSVKNQAFRKYKKLAFDHWHRSRYFHLLFYLLKGGIYVLQRIYMQNFRTLSSAVQLSINLWVSKSVPFLFNFRLIDQKHYNETKVLTSI